VVIVKQINCWNMCEILTISSVKNWLAVNNEKHIEIIVNILWLYNRLKWFIYTILASIYSVSKLILAIQLMPFQHFLQKHTNSNLQALATRCRSFIIRSGEVNRHGCRRAAILITKSGSYDWAYRFLF